MAAYGILSIEGLQAEVEQSTLSSRLMSFAKRRKTLRRVVGYLDKSIQILESFFEAMSGFAKLLSPKYKMWIVPLLLENL